MFMWKVGDLALFNLVGWYNPKIDKLPVVVLIQECIIGGCTGWYCFYIKEPNRKRFILNSELVEV